MKRHTPPDRVPAVAAADPASPFAVLGLERALLPPGPAAPTAASAPAPASAAPSGTAPKRAVVRLERKGRGGKEATVLERLDLPPPRLEELARSLKAALGCGGAVEGTSIALNGDQRDRVVAALRQRGVSRNSVS